jgi:nicotinate dehydrogenase subunit B
MALIINPKAVQAQIESNIIQGSSRTLKEEVAYDDSNVTSVDWRGYPIMTYPEIPQVNITLINRPDQPAGGVGEPATCPVAAAISSAIFDANRRTVALVAVPAGRGDGGVAGGGDSLMSVRPLGRSSGPEDAPPPPLQPS